MAVCSNTWCDKWLQVNLAETDYYGRYILDDIFWEEPKKKRKCEECRDLCSTHACVEPRLRVHSVCFKCKEAEEIRLEKTRIEYEKSRILDGLHEQKNEILQKISNLPPFCPGCDQLCYTDHNYNVYCKKCNYRGHLDTKLHKELKKIYAKITEHNKSETIEFISDVTEQYVSPNFQILDNNSRSFDGYFDWPTTEIHPTFHGKVVDTSEWPNQSPLNLMGYNVNSKENLSSQSRQEILSFVYASSTLPYVKSKSYMMEWGPANTPARLKKIADNLATHGRKMRRNGYKNPVMKYDDDLAYLKKKYYDGMFIGEWPSTQPYN